MATTAAFVAPAPGGGGDDVIDALDPSALRLGCGHAFHVECIVANFRRGLPCPTCRHRGPGGGAAPAAPAAAATRPTAAAAAAHAGGGGDSDSGSDISAGDAVAYSAADYLGITVDTHDTLQRVRDFWSRPGASDAASALTRVRTEDGAVRGARGALRCAVRAYRAHAETLKATRARTLRAAMSGFRQAHHADFLRRVQGVNAALQRVRAAEREAVARRGVDADVAASLARLAHGSPRECVGTLDDCDPFMRSFWRR